MSSRRMAQTNDADGCPSDVKPRRMGPTSSGFLSEGHPSVPFVLAFPVSQMDVPETAGGESVGVVCKHSVCFSVSVLVPNDVYGPAVYEWSL